MGNSASEHMVLQGECAEILKALPDNSIDFVLTDPPYIVNYMDRRGRTVANDQTPKQIKQVWRQVARVLKPDSLCFTFYSWQHVDDFLSAWKGSGLSRVGHIVFAKRYASAQRYLQYSHECAFLLAKGQPLLPKHPIPDVLAWHYSRNRRHPTEKSVETIKPIIETFTKIGDLILDPYAGSGSTLVAATLLNRRCIGVELSPEYCDGARRRLDGALRHLNAIPT